MSLLQLKYFREVVERESFTKASEILYVSQSTMSKSIQKLESELCTELIEKAKEFHLTPVENRPQK